MRVFRDISVYFKGAKAASFEVMDVIALKGNTIKDQVPLEGMNNEVTEKEHVPLEDMNNEVTKKQSKQEYVTMEGMNNEVTQKQSKQEHVTMEGMDNEVTKKEHVPLESMNNEETEKEHVTMEDMNNEETKKEESKKNEDSNQKQSNNEETPFCFNQDIMKEAKDFFQNFIGGVIGTDRFYRKYHYFTCLPNLIAVETIRNEQVKYN